MFAGFARCARVHCRTLPMSSPGWRPQPRLFGYNVLTLHFSSRIDETEPRIIDPKQNWLEKYFGKQSCEAAPTFRNRWAMMIPAFATQMSIGSTWAWSIMGLSVFTVAVNEFKPFMHFLFSDMITKEIGFVAPVAADWTLAQVCISSNDLWICTMHPITCYCIRAACRYR